MAHHDLRILRDRLESEFESMLAPDLAANGASRVHVVLASETTFGLSGEFLGLTGAYIHERLRPFVKNGDGPAPAMLIADELIFSNCSDNLGLAEDKFAAICVHELAHIVCVDDLYGRRHERSDLFAEVLSATFAASVADPAAFDPTPKSQRPDHGTDWLRACCHITHRMQKRGWPVFLPMVINADFYGISSTASYSRALGDEPERLFEMPITEINNIDAPTAFLDLWNCDLAEWPNG